MSTTTRRSEQAQCAAMIRRELTLHFPHTRFSVTSRSASMMTAVDVRWTDGPTRAQLDRLLTKYAEGTFDGSIDLYDYRNNEDNIPRAKYVQASREESPE